MSKLRFITLNDFDRAVFRATFAFLNGRLEERETIDWALRLKPDDTIQRMALLDLLDGPSGHKLRDPWLSAWRLIEESWNNPVDEDDVSTDIYDLKHRLSAGDRSGSLLSAIVQVVAPRLKVTAFSKVHRYLSKPPRRPKKVEDIFSLELTSGEIIDLRELELKALTDKDFLVSLAHALDAAVVNGLEIARRCGWRGDMGWKLGGLRRVYYVLDSGANEDEPDEFSRGIAPSVKLLSEAVSRLVDVDTVAAINFAQKWRLIKTPVHLRLWAALSRDARVALAGEVGEFLLSLEDEPFWDVESFPEIAELRAIRIGELAPNVQKKVIARIRRQPPKNHWPKGTHPDQIAKGRLYLAARELRRLAIVGHVLPKRDSDWLKRMTSEFQELEMMARMDEGFLTSSMGRAVPVPSNPDTGYNLLAGKERLKALEVALSSPRQGWNNPAGHATDWSMLPGNAMELLVDLESDPVGDVAFPRVWERFGWAHSPNAKQGEVETSRDLANESARVLKLLNKLPETAISQAIDGISHWLYTWRDQVGDVEYGRNVWFKIWQIVVMVTNTDAPTEEDGPLDTVASADPESVKIDTLNTPVGKLLEVFLASCPNIEAVARPFEEGGVLARMRNVVITAPGRSGLIVRYRLIESLPYFLVTAPEWTREHLINPLLVDNAEALALWRAIARRTRYSDVLKVIGAPMAERANDRRLDRETRRSFVFSLVVECLYALKDERPPAVSYPRIEQMLRSLEDELRAYGADAIQRFVRQVSTPRDGGQNHPSPEQLFRSSAAPFLKRVWPQERSLTTPGVSRALADLPATAIEAFTVAVLVVEPFLVPFECWALHSYGLSLEGKAQGNISKIDDAEKAAALLRLLDLTVGTSEGAVVPHDLPDALDQIRAIAPILVNDHRFRRLATATRR